VFIVHDPELLRDERVKLLDFGIAKRRGQNRTATGIVLGTPAYMAPEQSLGSRHVDLRADIYSLGVIVYLMATGMPPFAGADTDELLAEHAFCRPAPASRAGGVSRRLSAIIERCLEKRPKDRFATMGELGDVLRELEATPTFAVGTIDDVSGPLGGELDDATTMLLPKNAFGADPIS